MDGKIHKYYTLLEQWMQYFGYANLNINEGVNQDVDKVFRKSEFAATRFGPA